MRFKILIICQAHFPKRSQLHKVEFVAEFHPGNDIATDLSGIKLPRSPLSIVDLDEMLSKSL